MAGAPVLLVGTKIDLREDEQMIERLKEKGIKPISFEEGCKMTVEIGAHSYAETSALLGTVNLLSFDALETLRLT